MFWQRPDSSSHPYSTAIIRAKCSRMSLPYPVLHAQRLIQPYCPPTTVQRHLRCVSPSGHLPVVVTHRQFHNSGGRECGNTPPPRSAVFLCRERRPRTYESCRSAHLGSCGSLPLVSDSDLVPTSNNTLLALKEKKPRSNRHRNAL